MCLREALFDDYPVPEATSRVAHQSFPKGNIYIHLRDRFGMLYQNVQFAHLFSSEGHPSLAPARLALVTVFQFMEGLSDREAADHVRDRISWKYALGLPLDDPGFDFSVLSDFRKRLIEGEAEAILLETVLEIMRDDGLLKARGKQRTDSTHVLAAIRTIHRLENIGETLRHTLNELATIAPDWLLEHVDPSWGNRYGHRIEQYRLPKKDTERAELAITIGRDGYHLLDAIFAADTPDDIRTAPAVDILRRVWVQQFYRSDDPTMPVIRQRETDDMPPSALIISSPYDPDARCKTKRDTTWVGYKAHMTETCDDDRPNLITHVATTPATTADCAMTAVIHEGLADHDLLPAEHYLDSGYVDAAILVQSPQEHQVTVVGPVPREPGWQAHTPNGLRVAQFAIDWETHQAVCPEGKASRSWHIQSDRHGNEMNIIRFHQQDCRECQRRADCTKSKNGPRTLTLRPQALHHALQEARMHQQTTVFREQYARRAGVEGTFAQGNRRSDLRHARYIGLAKTHLQHVITAVAINLLRVIAWVMEVPRAQTRMAAFAVLMKGVT